MAFFTEPIGEWFSDIDGGNKVYAAINSVPPPNIGNTGSSHILMRTLPGAVNDDGTGGVRSGRVIYIPMGNSYEDTFELKYQIASTEFISNLRAKYASMADFIFNDGTNSYRVNFIGDKSLLVEQPNYASKTVTMKLINLGIIED